MGAGKDSIVLGVMAEIKAVIFDWGGCGDID